VCNHLVITFPAWLGYTYQISPRLSHLRWPLLLYIYIEFSPISLVKSRFIYKRSESSSHTQFIPYSNDFSNTQTRDTKPPDDQLLDSLDTVTTKKFHG
jgi:hypothetical protein